MSNRIVLTAGLVLAVCGLFAYVLMKRFADGQLPSPGDGALAVAAEANRDESKRDRANRTGAKRDGTAPQKKAGSGAAPAGRGGAAASSKQARLAPKPLLEGWERPAAAFVISGEMHGYIEPCGCSLHQLGGLSRRADLFRQIGERGWPVTGLDVGGLTNYPTRREGKFKFDMILKCLSEMRYSAVGMGVEELLLDADFLSYNNPSELPFSFLGANVVLFGDPELEQGPAKKKIVKVGDRKIAVTGVFGEGYKGDVLPQGGGEGNVEIGDPAEALAKVVPELEAEKPDLLVLLSHARTAESEKLLEKFPQFDVLVTAGGSEDPDPKPKVIGKTLVVAPGQKGKYVAVVGFYPKGGKERLKFELVALDEDRFRDTPKIQEHMRFFQDLLKEANLAEVEPAIESPRNAVVKEDNPFVGVKACGECHKSAYEIWQTTKHAHATESLKTGRPEQAKGWINRVFDPECIACHSTGWDPAKFIRYNTGYISEAKTPNLVGQQCENCHGPGGRHTELERKFAKDQKKTDELEKWRKFHRLSQKTAFDLCARCHDGDNDPHFNSDSFESYWEQIAHPGKD